MNIDFAAVQDIYPASPIPVTADEKKTCLKCHKTMAVTNFFKSYRIDKFKSGYIPWCKTCATATIQDTVPNTFLPLLKEIDIPYIPSEWTRLLDKKASNAGSIIGKYVSKIRLLKGGSYRWADSQKLYEEDSKRILDGLRLSAATETEAESQLESILGLESFQQKSSPTPALVYGVNPQDSKYNLTQEEINNLKVTWGIDYTEDQYFQLESLYADMIESYVIEDPISVQNARIICKMQIKLHKFLDLDDIASATQLSRQLDLFLKSSNLQPIQQKERQQTNFAISQLAYLIEKERGFIPHFYTEEPQDKIDEILEDSDTYLRNLVLGESNIIEMLEDTQSILDNDLPSAVEDQDDFQALEAELFEMEVDDVSSD